MKRFLISGALVLGGLLPTQARSWTDLKGRKIEAEYVSQNDDAVILKLKNGKEVSVPFKNLSPADLAHLVELETAEAREMDDKKEEAGDEKTVEAEKKEEAPEEGSGAAVPSLPDQDWEKPVPKKAVLAAPIEVEELKKGNLTHYSSKNYRIIADSRLKSRALETILEACEVTRNYCQALPFGLHSRYTPVDGKLEIHCTAEKEDWVKAGGPEEGPSTYSPATGQLNICLENMGLSKGGTGSESRMRGLAGQMILHVTRCMLPEIYERNLMDWFKEGFPNVINCAVFEKSSLDFTNIIDETKDLLLGKSDRWGGKPLFKKEIEMRSLADLVTLQAGGVPKEEQSQFLGQCILVMTYLVFMEDGGKATGLRGGLGYAYNFQKNFPKTIPAKTQEEFEEKKAALIQQQKDLGETTTARIFRERPWSEVEAEITKFWKEHGLKLVFPGAKKD
jgi:hypothetical protein